MNTGEANRFCIFPRRPNLVGTRRTITTQPVPIRNRSVVGVTHLTGFTRLVLSALLALELGSDKRELFLGLLRGLTDKYIEENHLDPRVGEVSSIRFSEAGMTVVYLMSTW